MNPITFISTGSATGWGIHQTPDGRWHWSAFGPNGGSQGTASSESAAESAAQTAERSLKALRSTET